MGRLTHRTSPASTYFVTTKTWGNRALFRVAEVAQIVTHRILACREKGAYLLHEFVVMPDHLHLLLTPAATVSLEKAMQLIKGGSSHEIHQQRDNRLEIWHPGFHDWTIRDGTDYQSKREYIWMNPVRAGLVERTEEWAYGSACGRFQLNPMPESFANSFRG